MRLPLAVALESRDGTLDQDALVKNGLVESRGETVPPVVRKRPGLTDLGLLRAGAAQLLYFWNEKVRAVIGDYLVGTIAPAATTLNSADKGATVTLSNGDLTMNATDAGFARSVAGISGQDWYFEVTVQSTGVQGALSIGLANSSASTAVRIGASSNGLEYAQGGAIVKNNATLQTGNAYTTNDIIGVFYDASAASIAFYKNNVLEYTATGANVPTGTLYAAIGAYNTSTLAQATVNFGATAFTYGAPGSTATNLSPTSAGLQFSAQDNGESAAERLLMVKNATQGWVVNTAGTPTAISDVDYPGANTVTLASLTRSSTTATGTVNGSLNFREADSVVVAGAVEADYNGTFTITGVTRQTVSTPSGDTVTATITRSGTTATATSISGPHNLTTGDSVLIAGADQSEYNGTFTATVTSPTAFTFTVSVTAQVPVTPATGTIVAVGAPVQCGIVLNVTTATIMAFHSQLAVADQLYITGVNGGYIPDGTYAVASITNGYPVITVSIGAYGSAAGNASIVVGSVSSVTSDGQYATVTTSAAHKLLAGSSVTITGANQSHYNGEFIVSSVPSTTTFKYLIPGASQGSPASPATGTITASEAVSTTQASFTYTVANSPTTPATGTITASSARETVPGIAYLNGYFCVMDDRGVIFNSAQDDPSAWNALDFTVAQNETGAGVVMARSQNYLVALKEWSTEFFYDAKNAVGSPFSPVENAFTQIGCANGWSIASVDGMLIWVSQARQKGRSVHVMSGMEQRKVSTPAVDRVLNADALTTVYAYCVKLDGHPVYVLTLTDSAVTLVYDLVSGTWNTWTACTIGSSKSVTSITRSGVIATVTTSTAHGLSDGDPVQISGATQTDYNGIFNALVTSTTAFEIQVANSPTTPATGTIVAYPYSESYFDRTHYCNAGGTDVTLHKTDGHLYELDPSTGQDDGAPINFFVRTARLDGGSTARKRIADTLVIGTTVSDIAAVRWSDDDCATYVSYRPVDLSRDDPKLRRCGSFRRRTFEVRHVDTGVPTFEALELRTGD